LKRVFCKLREEGAEHPKRLALFTRMGEVITDGKFRLAISQEEDIKFVEQCSEEDMEKFHAALDCYETYKEVIEASRVVRKIGWRLRGSMADGRRSMGWKNRWIVH
jgi:N-acetylglucosamine malate deacetylase 2